MDVIKPSALYHRQMYKAEKKEYTSMAESEVARLMRQIEMECEAMKRGMQGYAAVAKHQTIAHKYNAIGAVQEQLETLVGKQEAMRVVCETYERVIEQ